MPRVEPGITPEQTRHVLFVEGGMESLDPRVLRHLLDDLTVSVRPLGPSQNIRGAAESLASYSHNYYFLIDRDHHDDDAVEKTWRGFPDPERSNLLIWPRRELENYFIIPEYLLRSEWVSCSPEDVRRTILAEAQKRVYLDAANTVIIETRESLKERWVDVFRSSEGFETSDAALSKLVNMREWAGKRRSFGASVHKRKLAQRFGEVVDRFSGGHEPLMYEHGDWLKLVRGKRILRSIVNTCCRVVDAQDHAVQGPEAVRQVARDLLRLPLGEQPEGFQKLHRLIAAQVGT